MIHIYLVVPIERSIIMDVKMVRRLFFKDFKLICIVYFILIVSLILRSLVKDVQIFRDQLIKAELCQCKLNSYDEEIENINDYLEEIDKVRRYYIFFMIQ